MEAEIRAASSFNELAEILQRHESETQNIVHSITDNPESQEFIIYVRDKLRQEEKILLLTDMTCTIAQTRPHEAAAVKQHADGFARNFPELFVDFQVWKQLRIDLIKASEASAKKLQWTVFLGSMSRIFMSAVDLIAICMRRSGSEKNWIEFILNYSTLLNFGSLFFQALVTSQTFGNIKTLIEKDEKLFLPIEKWFQISKELENDVKNFFPYGIDPKIVADIEKSATIPDETDRIFMSVIISNVTRDINLLQNRKFLGKADIFSTSEAGAKWYRKILFEMDPLHIECFKYDLEDEIKQMKSSNTISRNENIIYSTLPIHTRMTDFKMFFDAFAIFSAVCSMMNEKSKKDSETLKKFSRKATKEFEGVQEVVDQLRPSNND